MSVYLYKVKSVFNYSKKEKTAFNIHPVKPPNQPPFIQKKTIVLNKKRKKQGQELSKRT